MSGLYIHIPFCIQKCPYCDFYSCDDRIYLSDDYLDCLNRELRLNKDKYNPAYDTLFIGGGTPSSLTEKQLDLLFSGIYGMASKSYFKEITIEANPETITEKKAKVIAPNVTRVSMGAQSFNDVFLKALGRIHDSNTVFKAIKLLRQQGVENINLDLMYGLPGQKAQDVFEDIKKAVSAGIEHISFYMLTVYEKTVFAEKYKNGSGLPGDDEIEEMYLKGVELLGSNGFIQYEISNFAKPGRECRHNLMYWNLGKYTGIGASASSFSGHRRYTNVKSTEEYIKNIKQGKDPADFSEEYTKDIELKEFIMLKLRTSEGLDYMEFKERFDFDFAQKYSNIIDKFRAAALMQDAASGIRLSARGFLLSNNIIKEFF
jgi:oxygen-independent coproporphyrinogen III oxidase